ncbi:oxidoreductase, partial [Acinetobacter baumannii]
MLKTIFQKFQKKQGCVVVAGHDIELLDQNFVILDKNEQSPLYVYQAVHDSSVQNIQVNRVNDGITSVRLNLVNTEHLKSLLKYIASHSHSIQLCVFQPNFSSAPNIEALSLEEIEHSWQTTGLSAVSVSQAVIKPMLKQQQGTVIFLGAPSNNSTHY